MGRRRSAWLGLAGWLVAGCTYTAYPAESTAAACMSGVDDDHDGLTNCDDPDCWRFALCEPDDVVWPPLGPTPVPSETPMTEDPDPLGTGGSHAMGDGSTPDHLPMTPDSGPPEPDDASVDAEQPLVCSDYCPSDQCNEDGSCSGPLKFGEFNVESITLTVPAMRGGECFDILRFGCTPALPCCAPDPVVTVYVGEEKAGFVNDVTDDVAPTWEGVVNMQLKLSEGDEVSFKVEDEDTPAVGDIVDSSVLTEIFKCSTLVTEAMIKAGRVGCAPSADLTALGEFYVAASFSPAGGEGGGEDEDAQADMP